MAKNSTAPRMAVQPQMQPQQGMQQFGTFGQLLQQIMQYSQGQLQSQQNARATNPALDTMMSSRYGNRGTPLPFGNQPINSKAFGGQYGISPAFIQLMNMFRQGRQPMQGGAGGQGGQRGNPQMNRMRMLQGGFGGG